MKSDTKPLLSILIPIFKYPEGLKRILYGLNLKNSEQYEVLIADNSDDDSAEIIINQWRNKSRFNISYYKNNPAIGPAQNWNKLLDKAKGRFSLLMHHDEFPIEPEFLSQLCKKIEESPKFDVFILDCILVDPRTGKNRRHIPTFIKSLLLRCSPLYLYRRNYIGPTATMVCRTECYPRFDERLIWLIDVDLYARMLLTNTKYMYLPNIKIGSATGRVDSITAKLSKSVNKIQESEIYYLFNILKIRNIWLNNNFFSKIVKVIELLPWTLMRAIEKLFNLTINHYAIKKSLISHAINPIDNK